MKKTLKTKKIIEGDAGAVGGDAGGAGAAAGGASGSSGDAGANVSDISISGSGIKYSDVLGHCDHERGEGFFGPGCFHIPSRVLVPYHRWELCNGGSKRKKGKKYIYDKNIKVIKNYKDMVSEDEQVMSLVYVTKMTYDQAMTAILNSKINNSRFNIKQFTKYRKTKPEFVGLFDKLTKECLALACVSEYFKEFNDCYIWEILSLSNGFGALLLNNIQAYARNTWLMADYTASEDLLNYYRRKQFNLIEYIVLDSSFGCPLHIFYSKNFLNARRFEEKLEDYYSDRKLMNEAFKLDISRLKNAFKASVKKVDREKVIKVLNKYSQNRKETNDKALKISKANVALLNMFDDVKTAFSFLKDAMTGKFKAKWSSIAIITAALAYLISPLDLIPDAAPVVGLLDDATVLKFAFDAVADEFSRYKLFKSNIIR